MKPPSTDPDLSFPSAEPRAELERALLVALRRDADALLALQARVGKLGDDGVYRFFHQSFKVFHLHNATQQIVDALQALLPDVPLNPWLMQVVADGAAPKFAGKETNANWLRETRPVVEAYLLAKQVLDMVCKFARAYEEPPTMFDGGWGTVLYLFLLR